MKAYPFIMNPNLLIKIKYKNEIIVYLNFFQFSNDSKMLDLIKCIQNTVYEYMLFHRDPG